jgi:hypothetical protein
MSDDPEQLPCPVCGGDPTIREHYSATRDMQLGPDQGVEIFCCSFGVHEKTEAEAWEAWTVDVAAWKEDHA